MAPQGLDYGAFSEKGPLQRRFDSPAVQNVPVFHIFFSAIGVALTDHW
jgi:hypothetical protein